MFIGLMGVDSDGMMYAPNGDRLFRLPLRIAAIIQWHQHLIAVKSWRQDELNNEYDIEITEIESDKIMRKFTTHNSASLQLRGGAASVAPHVV